MPNTTDQFIDQTDPNGEVIQVRNPNFDTGNAAKGTPEYYQAVATGKITPTKFEDLFSENDRSLASREFAAYSPSYQAWARANPQAFAQDLLAHKNTANQDLGSIGAEGGYSTPQNVKIGANGLPDYSQAGYLDIHDESSLGPLMTIAAIIAAAYGMPTEGLIGSGFADGAGAMELLDATTLGTAGGSTLGEAIASAGAAGSGYTGTLAELAADGLGGVPTASSSVLDTAFEAAKSQLSNLLDPSKIGENALRSLAQQGASNLLQGRDLTSGMDIGNLIKGMGVNAGLSALTAGAGAGIQDATGLSKPVSSYLAQAGLNTARGGSPLSSLVGAGVEQFGPSTGVDMSALRKYATPAVTGLLSGKGLDPKSLVVSGLANAAADQVPKNLGWADSGPLSWLQKGVTSGATGAVRNAVNKTLKG